MAQILVRGLEDEVRDQLREIARKNGQSVEEMVRNVLRSLVKKPVRRKRLGTAISEIFKDCGLQPGDIQELRGQTIEPIKFE